MKKLNIIYWTSTGLFAFFMLGSAIPNIISAPMSVEGFRTMGYPAYLLPFLGIAKLSGVIAILIPAYPRLKEWAYAGLMFDLIGAVYSLIALGVSPVLWMPVLVPVVCGFLSYIYYHKRIKAASLNLQAL